MLKSKGISSKGAMNKLLEQKAVGTESRSVLQPQMSTEQFDTKEIFAALEPAVDPATGEDLPVFANGLTEDQAINQAPEDLSISERFQLQGLGNRVGQLDYLSKKYGDARLDSDGNVVVPVDGKWRKMDPDSWGNASPFRLGEQIAKQGFDPVIKEALSDLVDIAPELAAGIGTTVVAVYTGGLSLLAQGMAIGGTAAGVSMLRTSAGKIQGTYLGTPEEQVKEAAMEAIFNITGQFFLPGMGWAGKRLTEAVGASGKFATKQLPSNIKDMIANTLGSFSNAGAVGVKHMFNEGPAIANEMKIALSGRDELAAKIFINNSKAKDVSDIASMFRSGLSKDYGLGLDKIQKNIIHSELDSLQYSPKEAIEETYKSMEDMGFISILKDGSAEVVRKDQVTMRMGEGKFSDVLLAMGSDEKAAEIIKPYVEKLNFLRSIKSQGGAKAISQFKKLEKTISDLAHSTKIQLQEKGYTDLAQSLNTINEVLLTNVQGTAEKSFGKLSNGPSLLSEYKALNSTYRTNATNGKELLDLQAKIVTGNDKAALIFSNNLSAARGGSTSASAVQSATGGINNNKTLTQVLEEVSFRNPQMQEKYQSFLRKDTAERFIKLSQDQILKFGMGGAIIGHAGAGALFAATTSPRAIGAGIRVASKVSGALKTPAQSLVHAIGKGRQFIMTRPESERIGLFQNVNLAKAFLQTIINVPILQQQTEQELDQQIQGAQQ